MTPQKVPPELVIKADDPLAMEVLHYYLSRYAADPDADMREIARLHSVAATFARWLTPEVPHP